MRIHLLRFTTLEAPKVAIEEIGGVFKPIRLLRGSAMRELLLLREVFNPIVGGAQGEAVPVEAFFFTKLDAGQ